MRPLSSLGRVGAFTARFGGAAGVIAGINWLFDYPFTGWSIWKWGPLTGGAVVLTLALIVNYAIVIWYRRTTADWFGMEWLRAQETLSSASWSGRIMRTALRTSRPVAFTALASLLDPIYAFIYQRGRVTGPRFTARDWWWFGLANALGILPWIAGASIAVEATKASIF